MPRRDRGELQNAVAQPPWLRSLQLRLTRLRGLGVVVTIFLFSRLAFYLVALFGNDHSDRVNQALTLMVHWRWDALHYYGIAVRGYEPTGPSGAFFPLLPLLIRTSATVLGGLRVPAQAPIESAERSVLLGGVLVAHGAALLAFWLLYQLVFEETGDAATAERAVLYTAIFPLAFLYAVPYTEGLFLATSVGAFLAARRGRWIGAGVWAALAAATRPVGILLVPVLALEVALAWRRGDIQGNAWARAALGLFLAPCGLLLFVLHLWQRVGDPLAFVHVARSYFRHENVFAPALLWRGITATYHSIRSDPGSPQPNHLIVFNTFAMLGLLAVLCASLRQWRPGYVLYGVLMCATILSSIPDGDVLRSIGRYSMVFFPVYITLARWGRRPMAHLAILLLWLPLLGLFAAFFLRGYFVG